MKEPSAIIEKSMAGVKDIIGLTTHKRCAPWTENPGEHAATFRLGTRQHFGLFGWLE